LTRRSRRQLTELHFAAAANDVPTMQTDVILYIVIAIVWVASEEAQSRAALKWQATTMTLLPAIFPMQ